MKSLTSVYFISIIVASVSGMVAAFIGNSIKTVSDQPIETDKKPVEVPTSQ
jgi:hypothetical protein